MKNKYKNPWWKSCNTPRPEFYENDAPQVMEHRGVRVFKLFDKAFDFVLGDCCITQRAGITEAKRKIDSILDGQTPVDTGVAKHLKRNGFKALSYERYTQLWQQGKMA